MSLTRKTSSSSSKRRRRGGRRSRRSAAGGVRVTPLGGLNEIGLNITCYETPQNMILVDCGLMFPEEAQLGVDVVIPDMTYVIQKASKLRALFITHAHEDHIGAIPYLAREVPGLTIYTTRLGAEFILHRLRERKLERAVKLEIVEPGAIVKVEGFSVEFIAVNHSIADACALAIDTPSGVIIHTGDFKIDHTPVSGQVTDLAAFARYGQRGVLALFSDSTNVESPGFSPSEQSVVPALESAIKSANGKVIASTFSSNIHRIQTLITLAKQAGRKVVFDGRSVINNTTIARNIGYLEYDDSDVVSLKDVRGMAAQKVLVITTGSQGEPFAALTRMATDNHSSVRIKPGDLVIFSSKTIPGNERSVSRLINMLYKQGAQVLYDRLERVHASGHAYQEELKTMINLVRPRNFIPIHGEYRFLYHHAALARSLGIPEEHVFILRNGTPLLLSETEQKILPEVPNGRVFIDGRGMDGIEEPMLMDRRSLGQEGVMVVHVALAERDGEILDGPHIITSGFDVDPQVRKELEREVRNFLNEAPTDAKAQWSLIKVEVRKTLRRAMKKRLDRQPMVLPVIVAI